MNNAERKVRHIVSDADYAQLEEHYQFAPQADDTTRSSSSVDKSTWQGRMVQHYHEHLYKEYVLADMTRASSRGQLGLRWRTRSEVESNKGSKTCGNKHCPSHARDTSDLREQEQYRNMYWHRKSSMTEKQEMERIRQIPHGYVQTDFEVPFSYVEQGQTKMELVKLRLCLRCTPLLFESRGESEPALATWAALQANQQAGDGNKEQEVGRNKTNTGQDEMDFKDSKKHHGTKQDRKTSNKQKKEQSRRDGRSGHKRRRHS